MSEISFYGYVVLHDGKHYITPYYKHTKIYNEIPSENQVRYLGYGRRKAEVAKVKITVEEIVREDKW